MEQLLPQIINLLIPVGMALLARLTASATRWINTKVKNEYLNGVLNRLNDAVYVAVRSTEQTLAGEIREAAKDGKLTQEEADEVKEHAVKAVKNYLGKNGMSELRRILDADAIEQMIDHKIEATLLDSKTDSK